MQGSRRRFVCACFMDSKHKHTHMCGWQISILRSRANKARSGGIGIKQRGAVQCSAVRCYHPATQRRLSRLYDKEAHRKGEVRCILHSVRASEPHPKWANI